MQQEASNMGAHSIINVRLETASITKGSNNQTTCIEVYAYGTALIKTGSETISNGLAQNRPTGIPVQ